MIKGSYNRPLIEQRTENVNQDYFRQETFPDDVVLVSNEKEEEEILIPKK